MIGCGPEDSGDDETRHFANDPVETKSATHTPAPTATRPARTSAQSTRASATPADVLKSRGAPSTVYAVAHGRLVAITFIDRGPSSAALQIPAKHRALAWGASPTGDRLAVLVQAPDHSVWVLFFDPSGAEAGIRSRIEAGGQATAAGLSRLEAHPRVVWIPQARGVLVTRGGTVTAVDPEMGAKELSFDGVEGQVILADWSPTGRDILVQTVNDDRTQNAYLVSSDSMQARELRAVRARAGEGVTQLRWLPTGTGIVYVRGTRSQGELLRGNLYRLDFGSEVPKLIATSGPGGPSSTITDVSIAPDGRSLAYVISILDVDTWSFNSLWVMSLKKDTAYEVRVSGSQPIDNVQWTRAGLLWRQGQPSEPGQSEIGMVNRDGQVMVESSIGAQATPVASPAGSPAATPRATPKPRATPTSSPAATPRR